MNKKEIYLKVIKDIKSILSEEKDQIARMSTICSLLKHYLPHFSWVGFYRKISKDGLVIGPYQGEIGCLRIKFGRGICGTSAEAGKTIIVNDVSKIDNYIACDTQTKSEIVVPVWNKKKELVAVLDIDSNITSAFDDVDREYLEKISDLIDS